MNQPAAAAPAAAAAAAAAGINWAGIRGVLCDISGVLYDPDGTGGGEPIQGSIEAVRILKASSIQLQFLTNESQCSSDHLVQKLQRFGFPITDADVMSPVTAVGNLLAERKWRAHLLVHKDCAPALSAFTETDPARPVDCVVVGDAAESFDYAAMGAAFRRLCPDSQSPARLISLGMGRYYRQAGRLQLDAGPFVKALEFASGVQAEVVGKPSPQFFHAGIRALGMSPSEAGNIAMVGDDIVSDVGGGMTAGLAGVQVRTGKYSRERDEPHLTVRPSCYVNNLKEFTDRLMLGQTGN